MKIKSHIRSVQLIFSIFMFLIFAGLTGCKDDGAEFLEKELVQEESTETSGVDLEQEDPTDAESGVSEKKSEEKQVDTVQETAAAKQQPEISEIPETIYVDICGAVTSPGVYELPYGRALIRQPCISGHRESRRISSGGSSKLSEPCKESLRRTADLCAYPGGSGQPDDSSY